MYVEDLDLCWRAWLRGWPSVYVPAARLRHRVGAVTTERMRARRSASSHHNLLRFALKCLPPTAAARVVVGELLRLRYGVRCMTVEAGWTRTPSDGFMRLGALAFARITHFGLPHENAEFVLTDNGDGQTWARVRRERPDKDSSLEELEGHFRVLLDERR